ncbi:symmetrical bis(5'-nucleosyl)-tetraphosphatase [Candidatus Nitrosacidococcus sp. I8]|uniref:symmetrical bis(5'-nucleosyl)-tetraphosphatase n=1 Tax=Candidatus Nitrosacidococcus sp. I8 TaxID=2942908 RepID=UPI002227DCA1|nr:symmetrical bis(5'-nucleosyl)-tetraphosphatase [Candidatus Nitrosacidococcus sp. I8]CAH9018489.1 Bis(5'-nucleosyl)-tetraphosphatase, symmetrical [Candidatus Nitrosacidococcus sp. I8]
MAIYAIGDIQGCYDELQQLLSYIQFNPKCDQLWLTGDLVNRGSKSLETLRFIHSLGNRAITVLGNHDLHLLALAAKVKEPRSSDTLNTILAASDREELITWLRYRPLLYQDFLSNTIMVHAGLLPQWDIPRGIVYARSLEKVLQGENWQEFLAHMYGDTPNKWSEELRGWDRLRLISNGLTRVRYCNSIGEISLKEKYAPNSKTNNEGLIPWFEMPSRRNQKTKIIFGHWATLNPGIYNQSMFALDGGCVWGGKLVALRVDGGIPRWFSIPCPSYKAI